MEITLALWYILPAFFVLILIFPILVEVRFGYNPLENSGVFSVFLLRKKLFHFFFSLHGTYVQIKNEKKAQSIEFEFASPEFLIWENFGKKVWREITLLRMNVFYQAGVGDAFETAIFCGCLNQMIYHFFVFLRSKKPTARLLFFDTPAFNAYKIEVAGSAKVSISVFALVYSFIHSVMITKRA